MTAPPSYDWDWDHAILLSGEISDELVASLMPEILRLKQSGTRVITVGIDSLGGSIAAARQLLAILKSPGINGKSPTVVTVAINKAFSAAATLLALGDYAVALPSAQIHYHDLRYGAFYDLTSTKAVEAARDLQRENNKMALLLAQSVVERLTWIFIDLSTKFDKAKQMFPALVASVDELGLDDILDTAAPKLDFAGFVCAQYTNTSQMGDSLIEGALQKLKAWRQLELAFNHFMKTNNPEENAAALFRDDNPLLLVINRGLDPAERFSWAKRTGLQHDLVLLLLLLFRKATATAELRITDATIADLMNEYAFFREIRRKQHVETAVKLIVDNDYILFDHGVAKKLKESTKEEHDALIGVLFPQVQIFWAYVVLMCRSLFDGEHPISLDDALFLGLIDEIAGRKFPEPRRSVRNQRIADEMAEASKAKEPVRKWLKPRRVP